MPNRVAAIVLAAGASARMGRPKQLLPLGNTTVLNQTLTNLAAANLEQIILVLGANAQAIQQQLPTLKNLTIAHNPRYTQGLSTSLQAGIAALTQPPPAVLIVLADQPFIRPQTLHQLAHHEATAPILIPTWQARAGNPVRIGPSLFPQIMQLTGDTGCRALFAHNPTEHLPVDDPGILDDLDHPDDYRRLVKA